MEMIKGVALKLIRKGLHGLAKGLKFVRQRFESSIRQKKNGSWSDLNSEQLRSMLDDFRNGHNFARRVVQDPTAPEGPSGFFGLWLPEGKRLESDEEFEERIDKTIEAFESQEERTFWQVRESIANETYKRPKTNIELAIAQREGVTAACSKCSLTHYTNKCPEVE